MGPESEVRESTRPRSSRARPPHRQPDNHHIPQTSRRSSSANIPLIQYPDIHQCMSACFATSLCRAGPSSVVRPVAQASLRHALPRSACLPPSPVRPSRRWVSMSDSKLPTTSPTDSGLSIVKTKLDPDSQSRRDAVLAEVKRSEESKGVQGEVRLSFTVLGEHGTVTHPHLAYTKAEVNSSSPSHRLISHELTLSPRAHFSIALV